MHYRYANHHLEEYTCSSFDSNLGVVKLNLYYFWSWGCFSWIADWGHLSFTAAQFVWSSESSDDCWKRYPETKVGNSWTNPTDQRRWVFFCILYSAVSWQLVACRKVLGFRSSIHAQALSLALEADFPVDFISLLLNEGFGFWDISLMDKCESYETLSEHVSFLFAAHSEALMKEVERLSYQHQQQLPPLSPPGFDIPQKKFSKWDLGPQQQHSPLFPTGYELLKQQFSKLDLGAHHQQQQQQLPPLSPTGYELQLQRFSKVDLGSQ